MSKSVVAAPPREGSLVVLLRYCEHILGRRLQPLLDEAGLSHDHWRIMALLHAHPGLGMGAIATGAVLPSASATRHVDKLVERGMVVRRANATDRRRVVAALSPRGNTVAERLLAEERAVERIISTGLGADRFAEMSRALGKLPLILEELSG